MWQLHMDETKCQWNGPVHGMPLQQWLQSTVFIRLSPPLSDAVYNWCGVPIFREKHCISTLTLGGWVFPSFPLDSYLMATTADGNAFPSVVSEVCCHLWLQFWLHYFQQHLVKQQKTLSQSLSCQVWTLLWLCYYKETLCSSSGHLRMQELPFMNHKLLHT